MHIPIIDEQKCSNCCECVDVCPADVMEEQQGDVKVVKPEECLGCDSCLTVCAEEAITVEEV
jgi:NAD-dependent dihydropyrimidine dehydrogenase PreA subunit